MPDVRPLQPLRHLRRRRHPLVVVCREERSGRKAAAAALRELGAEFVVDQRPRAVSAAFVRPPLAAAVPAEVARRARPRASDGPGGF